MKCGACSHPQSFPCEAAAASEQQVLDALQDQHRIINSMIKGLMLPLPHARPCDVVPQNFPVWARSHI
eukprot:3057164-Amphidinium_carterae.1